jgi:hypothetical protein
MLVEAALEHFLNPMPSVEALLRERLDGIHARFDHLERDMRIIAETVALHARYHLTVVPPLPESRQRETVVLGDERFKVLAEQVDRQRFAVQSSRSVILLELQPSIETGRNVGNGRQFFSAHPFEQLFGSPE